MAYEERVPQGQYSGIFLLVAGMGIGGFTAAILFGFAVGAHLIHG
jgi:hypothetical protein